MLAWSAKSPKMLVHTRILAHSFYKPNVLVHNKKLWHTVYWQPNNLAKITKCWNFKATQNFWRHHLQRSVQRFSSARPILLYFDSLECFYRFEIFSSTLWLIFIHLIAKQKENMCTKIKPIQCILKYTYIHSTISYISIILIVY